MTEIKKHNLVNMKYLTGVAVLIAIVMSLNIYAGLAVGALAFGYIVFLIFGEEALVAFTIVTFLAVTEQLGETIRFVVQVVNFSLLIFLFVRKYGTEFAKYPRIPKKMKIFISLLYSAFFLSFVFTSYKELAFAQIIRTTVFLLLIYLYYALISPRKSVNIVINAIIIITFFFGIYLFYEFYLSAFDLLHLNAKLFSANANRYLHKNTYAIYFAITLPVIIVKYLSAERKGLKYSFVFLMLFFLSGLIITNSRSVLLALFAAVIYLIYKINKKYLLYPAILVLITVPFFFFEPVAGWLDIYFRIEKISTGRDWILQTIFNIPWKYYIFGTGPAATQFYMWEYLPFQIGSPKQLWMEHHFKMLTYGHAHNFYLFYFSDLGILGFAAALYLVYTFFSLSKNTGAFALKKEKLMIYGLTAAGLTIFIRGLFEWSGILSYGEINKDLPFWLLFISLTIFARSKNE